MQQQPSHDITRLLQDWRLGDSPALEPNGTRLDGRRLSPGKPVCIKSGGRVELAGTSALRFGSGKREQVSQQALGFHNHIPHDTGRENRTTEPATESEKER